MKLERNKSSSKETQKTKAKKAPANESISVSTSKRSSSKTVGCKHCPGHFADKTKLMKHMETHTGPRYYTCDQCASKYKSKDNFVKHRQTQHGSVGIVVRKKVGKRIKSEKPLHAGALEWNDNQVDLGEFIIDGLYLSDENQLSCRVRNLDCFSTRNLIEMKTHRETFHQLLEQRISFEKWMNVLPDRFLNKKDDNVDDIKDVKIDTIDVVQVLKDVSTDHAVKVEDDQKHPDPIKKEFGDLLVKLKHRYTGR
eukprot:GFUD01007026.1.p1 GENE.GFUD01007026.1~~GFUD01007026.1.p1  ORF type:complete len:253 (-),score=59.32 GFUD01007026.1:23-781(-)